MRYLFWILLCFGTFSVSAQHTVGVKGGMSLSRDRLYSEADYGFEPGLYYFGSNFLQPVVGLYTDFKLSSLALLQTELAYMNLGTGRKYLSVPISLKYSINDVSMYVGPYAGLLLNPSRYRNAAAYDWGSHAGIEYFIKGTVGVGVRYIYGICDLDKKDGPTLTDPITKVNTRALYLYIYYSFTMRRKD